MKTQAEKLLAAQRQLERDGGSLTRRQLDQRLAEFDQLLADVLADPGAVEELAEVLRTTDEPGVRWMLQDRLLPPRRLALDDPDAFRGHPLVGFTAEQLPIRPCLALVDLGRVPDVPAQFSDDDYPPHLSWFAGLPADDGTGDWPRNDAGDPLSHIAQVDLGSYTDDLGADDPTPAVLGLPEVGVLQLFHDQENHGNLDDPRTGSWCLRWVESPTRLLDPPDALAGAAEASEMAVAMVASVPSLLDHTGPGQDRYERVAEHLSTVRRDDPNRFGLPIGEDWTLTTAWEDDFESLDGDESSLGGFGYPALTDDVAEVLAAKLPLKDGDGHVLVLDLAGTRALEDWFGDSGHLQAWMRASDLEQHNFDQTWCIIRTD